MAARTHSSDAWMTGGTTDHVIVGFVVRNRHGADPWLDVGREFGGCVACQRPAIVRYLPLLVELLERQKRNAASGRGLLADDWR